MLGRGTRKGTRQGQGGFYGREILLDWLQRIAADLGRTPRKLDLVRLSKENASPSYQPYVDKFGSFGKAIVAAGLIPFRPVQITPRERKGMGRHTNNSQRFRVFLRDGFRCVYCGARPADGIRLVIDHILPYSAGGKTLDENLKTSCNECNRGKGVMIMDLERLVL